MPSPASGTLTQILVQEGETVDVGTKLGQIGGAAPAASARRGRQPSPSAARAGREEACAEPDAPAPAAPSPQRPAPAAPAPARERQRQGVRLPGRRADRVRARRRPEPGRRHRPGGRVTKKDILAFVESGGAQRQPRAAPAAPAQPAAPAPHRHRLPSPAAPASRRAGSGRSRRGAAGRDARADHRHAARHRRAHAPLARHRAHVTSAIEVDFSRIVAARNQLKKEYQAAYGVNPTYLAFVAKATVETLRDYPYVNAEMRGDSIVTRNFVNLGIAVELADGKGLIVPVIRNAEGLNLLGLARGIVDIATKARNKQLVPDDVQGGTFTITNPGGYGTFHGTPVISQPQSAILGTYALVKRPWVVEDELGQDVIAIRPMMNITLTYDHRLVDGAYAGRFLRDLRERLESWEGEES